MSSPSAERPIKVLGAGISGLNAAIELARGGFDVELYEKKKRVGPSAGAHMEGLRNYLGFDAMEELLGYGVELTPALETWRLIRLSPEATSTVRGLCYYLLTRGPEPQSAENQLYEQAVDEGVRVFFRTRMPEHKADIVATGAPKDSVNMIAAGYQFSKEGADLPDDTVYALFDNRYAPHGYLVVVPGIRENSIYSVSWTELRFDVLFNMVDAAMKLPTLQGALGKAEITGRIVGKAHYSHDPLANSVRDGRIYVGEAAGFQDATSGFGFRYACITGRLAARSIVDNRDFRELIRETIGPEIQRGVSARRMLSDAPNEFYDSMLRDMGEELTVEEYIEWRKTRPF